MCLIDRMGSGVTHAIGTGGRDLSPAVGGAGMRQGIELLRADPATQVLVLISKPPDRQVAEGIIAAARRTMKPVVVCFLGQRVEEIDNIHSAETLEAAALLAVKLAGVEPDQEGEPLLPRGSGSGLLRGFFAGGTLAYEAMVVLRDRVDPILSNKPLSPEHRWNGLLDVEGHLCLDLGSEEYTTGKPHPMIDPSAQGDLIADALADQRVSVILFDVVIGTGSHSDPAGKLIAAIEEGRRRAIAASSGPSLVASVTGTDEDLQCRRSQVEKLSRAGVIVAPSNASAARSAAALLGARDPARIL
jgi:FdrA protein